MTKMWENPKIKYFDHFARDFGFINRIYKYLPTKFLGVLRSVVISFLVTASRVRNDLPAKSGDGTAATTIDGDLDKVDMVVEIKASDKILTDEKYYEEMKAEHREALEANLPEIDSFYNKLQCTVCSKNVDPVIGELNDFISSTKILRTIDLWMFIYFLLFGWDKFNQN